MPSEGWRNLVTPEWARSVKLHNLPISNFGIQIVSKKSTKCTKSVYELQRSAESWDYYDFKESANQPQ